MTSLIYTLLYSILCMMTLGAMEPLSNPLEHNIPPSLVHTLIHIEPTHYDPLHRPQEVQILIDTRFHILSQRPSCEWSLHNGTSLYNFFSCHDHSIVKSIILNAPAQENFYVMDMGGGRFQWGYALANYLNHDPDLKSRHFKMHIVNTSAEQWIYKKVDTLKKCTLYHLGQCDISNLKESLNKENLLNNGETFDFITSAWCLRHLIDPLGTCVQAYNLLGVNRPMFFDGFPVSIVLPGETHPNLSIGQANCFLIKALQDMNIPFLMEHVRGSRCLNNVMVLKTDTSLAHIPYTFDELHDFGELPGNVSRYYVRFQGTPEQSDIHTIEALQKQFQEAWSQSTETLLFGDPQVFDILSQDTVQKSDSLALYS